MFHITPVLGHLIRCADSPSAQENETTRLWEYVFTRIVFKDDTWIVASQQAPTLDPTDRRKVDLVVEKWTNSTATRLLYMEAKRADATQTELVEVEYQGFTAAVAHCQYFNAESISVMTCAGSKSRLWIYRRGDDYLTPLYPRGIEVGVRNEYVGLEEHAGKEIIERLKYLRNHHLPAAASTIPSNCSPRPSNVILSGEWRMDHSHSYNPTSYSAPLQSSGFHAEASTSAVQKEYTSWGPVDVWAVGEKFRFRNDDDRDVETFPNEWIWHGAGELKDNWVYVGKSTGMKFFATSLPW